MITFNSSLIPSVDSIAYVFFVQTMLVVFSIVIPGERVDGVLLKDGKSRVKYKMNGTLVQMASLFCFILFSDHGVFQLFRLSMPYEQYIPILSALFIFSFIFSIFLYLRAYFYIPLSQRNFSKDANILEHIWCGGELNPHLFGFELKLFGYRPGLVFATFFVISAMAAQFEMIGRVSLPMILFFLMHMWYAIDCFLNESGLTFMFDIIEENYGMMLCWGCYFWMPLVFSLQSVYLVHQSFDISPQLILFTFIIYILGFFIFRGANNQKIQFRTDPTQKIWGSSPQIIQTGRPGKNLLCSGWWGIARKINYTGDILIAVGMSLPCRFTHLMPWLYAIYLTALLIHRARRDDKACLEKYGRIWHRYCEKVPYIMVPYIY